VEGDKSYVHPRSPSVIFFVAYNADREEGEVEGVEGGKEENQQQRRL